MEKVCRAQGTYMSMIASFAPIVILIVLFYFLLIRPAAQAR